MKTSPEWTYSEQPALISLQQLGYQYFNRKEKAAKDQHSEVVLKDKLFAAIQRINPWIDELNLNKAYEKITTPVGNSLMEINQNYWELLRGGTYTLPQTINGKEDFHTVHFIDYQQPENNEFLVANQLKFKGKSENSVPDLVIYLNGLPMAIIECKSPKADNAWDKAYSDLDYYQNNSPKLFHYNQICVGLWQVGGRYGAIAAPQKFYSLYRSPKTGDPAELGEQPTEQDKLLYFLFKKEHLLDIIRHFVIFEMDEGRTLKKLPRYQQLRATNQTIERLQAGQGGVVWHTQGSGKSITMAYVTRKLQASEFGFKNPTVMVLTDRTDLDQQITDTFRRVGFKNVRQAASVAGLDAMLRNDYGGIVTSTLQKFQENKPADEAEDGAPAVQSEEQENRRIKRSLDGQELTTIIEVRKNGKWVEKERRVTILEELSQKKNLYILVDEAHRSQYGFLAAFMRTVLPHAKFVAFTGTPISKEDKSTLGEFYGGTYIDVYTIKESVADGATVELLYDEYIAKIKIDKAELDKKFEEKFGHFSADRKDKLKKEALKKHLIAEKRLAANTRHIIQHYQQKIHKDGHKGMIVCSGRPAAIRYQQTLMKLKKEGVHNLESKVIISLGSPKTDPIAKEYYEAIKWNKEHPTETPRPTWVIPPEQVKTVTNDFKLPFGNEAELDKSGTKKKYDNTALLIVSDMLLTGYDAPIASCLYLDKPLKEHNLLQAIARVNRSREGKNAGFVVDYNGITAHLIEALEIFSGDLRPDDILKNINEEIPILAMHRSKLVDFFKVLHLNRNTARDQYVDAAVRFLEPIDRRDIFKTLLKQFNKSVNIVLPHPKALDYQDDFKLYNEIKARASNVYIEDEGLKISKDESKMLLELIDEHLHAEGVESLLDAPVSIIDRDQFEEEMRQVSPATKELKMRNNLKHTIKVGLDKNPDFYKPLAQRLEELLKQKEAQRLDEAQLLEKYIQMQGDIIAGEQEGQQHGFTSERSRVVFSSMKTIFGDDSAVEATQTLFDLVAGELSIVDWERKSQVKNDIKNKIKRFLYTKLSREMANAKAKELVELIRSNKN